MLLRALAIVCAIVFALPSCFTSAMWRNVDRVHTTGSWQAGTASIEGRERGAIVLVAGPEAAALLHCVCPGLKAGDRVRVTAAPDELARLRADCATHLDLRPRLVVVEDGGRVTTQLEAELPGICWHHVACAVAPAPTDRSGPAEPFVALTLEHREQRADGLLVTRAVLLTPFTLLLDGVLGIVFLPVWLLS